MSFSDELFMGFHRTMGTKALNILQRLFLSISCNFMHNFQFHNHKYVFLMSILQIRSFKGDINYFRSRNFREFCPNSRKFKRRKFFILTALDNNALILVSWHKKSRRQCNTKTRSASIAFFPFFFFYLFRCPTSYERAQNTRLHR